MKMVIKALKEVTLAVICCKDGIIVLKAQLSGIGQTGEVSSLIDFLSASVQPNVVLEITCF